MKLEKKHKSFNKLIEIIKILRSPNGCNWDKEQTHKSLVPYLIEETYEIVGHFNKTKSPRYGVFSHLKDKYIYAGEMKNGMFHGKGVFSDNSKIVYEGKFKNGFMHGKGTMTYPKSKKYPNDSIINSYCNLSIFSKKYIISRFDYHHKVNRLESLEG